MCNGIGSGAIQGLAALDLLDKAGIDSFRERLLQLLEAKDVLAVDLGDVLGLAVGRRPLHVAA